MQNRKIALAGTVGFIACAVAWAQTPAQIAADKLNEANQKIKNLEAEKRRRDEQYRALEEKVRQSESAARQCDKSLATMQQTLRQARDGNKAVACVTAVPAAAPKASDTALAHAVGEEFQHDFQGGGKGPVLVMLPTGSFKMGADKGEADEKNGPQVTIAKPFAMGKFEVTVKEYLVCVTAGKCKEPKWREAGSEYHYKTGTNEYYKQFGDALINDSYPIMGVSWHDAKDYVKWLNEIKTERVGQYSLPSEAQWEYAARASSATKWGYGDDEAQLGDYAWYSANSDGKMHIVGTKVKNKFGLHDMHGNVWEWVEDCYHESYSGALQDGSIWLKGCQKDSRRVLRGGSWDGYPVILRSAYRVINAPAYRSVNVGFRVAWTQQ